MIYTKVAERTFAVRTDREPAMLRLMEGNYAPFRTDPCKGEKLLFSVDIDAEITLPDSEPVRILEYPVTDDLATLRIYPERYILSIFNSRSGKTFSLECPLISGDGVSEYNFASDMTRQGIAPPLHIIDHLLIFAFSVAGVNDNIMLIHASTIVFRGKAVMFLAESGTGKSTHTRMWLENIAGTALLNDDAPALRVCGDGVAYAYGTPWSGKTHCYKNERYPLAAMVRIERAPYNKITLRSPLAAFGAVLPSCLPALQQQDDMLDPVCDIISEVIGAVSVFTLECLPDPDAALVSCRGIFGTE